MKNSRLALCVVAAAMGATPALAQKSKDTLRVGFYQPLRLVDAYFQPGPEASLVTRMVFDTLVRYDATKREFVPGLAESFRQVDPETMEFKLREGVKFTDGAPLTMDDVEYTYKFAMDPKANYRFKQTRINWIAGFERVDDRTFRIKAKNPMGVMPAEMTSWPAIYPKHLHAKLSMDKKRSFGQHPVGSGPYKVGSFDPGRDLVLVRNDAYHHGNPGKPAGKIGRVQITPVPDAQSQIARLITDQQDLMYNMDKDQALQLAKHPDIKVDVEDSVSFDYIMFDVKGRSGKNYFKDIRVRQAVLHAINRKDLRSLVHPAIDRKLETVCHPWVQGCVWSVNAPGYDPAKAKRLLAEAGYPNGFDVPILTWGEAKPAAEAVAGQLRKIGIRATVNAQTFGSFVKARAKGEPLLVTLWDNSVGQPDINNTASYFFLPTSRNYNKDPELEKLTIKGRGTIGIENRKPIYKEIFDKATERAYLMPLIPLPAIVAHRNTVRLLGGHKNPKGFEIDRVDWN